MDYQKTVETARQELLAQLSADDPKSVLKSSIISDLYQQIKDVDPGQRAHFGKAVNDLVGEIKQKVAELEDAQAQANVQAIDVTAPFAPSTKDHVASRPQFFDINQASLHPLRLELNRVVDIFTRMGFVCEEARQIDDDYHMFASLNFPENHPARDGYDTFRTEEGFIPPAHTTAMENRVLRAGLKDLEAGKAIAHVCYGRVFRNENADVTHNHTFHQFEGVYVSKKANLGQMLGLLKSFFETYYEQELNIKTQPGYFPFTEPSLEFQIEKPAALGGQGKGGEWLEMLGCGMLHPNVLKEAGIDPDEYRGFAWGGGLERLVMLKYGVEDLRHFESGKLAFLRKFGA